MKKSSLRRQLENVTLTQYANETNLTINNKHEIMLTMTIMYCSKSSSPRLALSEVQLRTLSPTERTQYNKKTKQLEHSVNVT